MEKLPSWAHYRREQLGDDPQPARKEGDIVFRGALLRQPGSYTGHSDIRVSQRYLEVDAEALDKAMRGPRSPRAPSTNVPEAIPLTPAA